MLVLATQPSLSAPREFVKYAHHESTSNNTVACSSMYLLVSRLKSSLSDYPR